MYGQRTADNNCLMVLAEEVAMKTIKRSVITAPKPNKQSFIHQVMLKINPKATPSVMKKAQSIQQKRDKATLRLRM